MEDLVELPGVIPSSEVRARLRAEGRPVLLAMSRGKDALACAEALNEAGIEWIGYHLNGVPGLRFVRESLDFYEQHYQRKIIDLPHPSIYRQLINYVYQSPDRLDTIDACDFAKVSYGQMVRMILDWKGLPADTWVVDGVRAFDSPMRRSAMLRYGPVGEASRKVRAVWDWKTKPLLAYLKARGVPLPVDYQWFKRSYDGLDARFLGPLMEHAPEDAARVLEWFPLAHLGVSRATLSPAVKPTVPLFTARKAA